MVLHFESVQFTYLIYLILIFFGSIATKSSAISTLIIIFT